MKILLGAAIGAIALTAAASAADKMHPIAHAHIGHVASGWTDTPKGMGLLPTALAEAKIAGYHAGVALTKPGNLAWLKAHTWHAVHAVDPRAAPKGGPGLGYGVRKAALGVAYHIRVAAKSKDSTANIKLHVEHVAVAANNSVARVNAIIAAGRKIQAARSAGEALPLARKIALWSKQLTAGSDANGDGKITWVKGEGGLKQAKAHLGFMMQGENIAMMKM
ncbi:MAG: hypothetical protein ACTSUD_08890 [Alphaproteobacteria bacterium]